MAGGAVNGSATAAKLHAAISRAGTATACGHSATVLTAHDETASASVVAASTTAVNAPSAASGDVNVRATTAVKTASSTAPEPTTTATTSHFGNGWCCDPNKPKAESNAHHHCCFHCCHHSTSVQGRISQGLLERSRPWQSNIFSEALLWLKKMTPRPKQRDSGKGTMGRPLPADQLSEIELAFDLAAWIGYKAIG
jgi:hypothetical protein